MVTASEVHQLLGLGYKSRGQLLRVKAGLEEPEDLDAKDLAQVNAGRNLEEGIFAWFASETSHTTAVIARSPDGGPALLAAAEFPRLGATPDALMDGEPVEIKCVGETGRYNWHLACHYESVDVARWLREYGQGIPEPDLVRIRYPQESLKPRKGAPITNAWRQLRATQIEMIANDLGPPRAPLKYWLQLQTQLLCLGAQHGWIVGCIGGTTRYDLAYSANQAVQALIVDEARKFWTEVGR
jgi:hypothetical protein